MARRFSPLIHRIHGDLGLKFLRGVIVSLVSGICLCGCGSLSFKRGKVVQKSLSICVLIRHLVIWMSLAN